MVKITAPDPALSGRVVGLTFKDGVAEADALSRPQALYLATHGYAVAGENAAPQAWDVPDESWTKSRIVEHAERRGIDVSSASTKADLLTAVQDAGTGQSPAPGAGTPPAG